MWYRWPGSSASTHTMNMTKTKNVGQMRKSQSAHCTKKNITEKYIKI